MIACEWFKRWPIKKTFKIHALFLLFLAFYLSLFLCRIGSFSSLFYEQCLRPFSMKTTTTTYSCWTISARRKTHNKIIYGTGSKQTYTIYDYVINFEAFFYIEKSRSQNKNREKHTHSHACIAHYIFCIWRNHIAVGL